MTTIQPAVPICEKAALTLEEAAAYSNIGINKLREITNERNCDFVFFVGNKRLIKRKRFGNTLTGYFLCESSKKLCISSSIHLFRDDRFARDMIYYLCHTKALCPVEQKGDWHGYKMQ